MNIPNLGQHHPGTMNGKMLTSLASLPFINTIVEVGTLDGTCSTLSILNGIKARNHENPVEFYSIEANRQAYDLARLNLSPLPAFFHLIYGSLFDADSPILIFNMTEQEMIWWKSDLDFRINAPNVIQNLPVIIDLLFLDGSEFTGFNDFLKLGPRAKVIVMDDISSRKNRLSRDVSALLGFVEVFTDGRLSVLCHFQRSVEILNGILNTVCTMRKHDTRK